MFTGIIEEVGSVVDSTETSEFRTIHIRTNKILDDAVHGSSIAVNGVCLTVRSLNARTFTAELSRETLDRTTLKSIQRGSSVNLERPMRADGRFGGHIVQGHVDGTGQIRSFERTGDCWNLEIEFPPAARRYIIEKGSIAVDGISLTVAALHPEHVFSVAIIPHTFENTNLKSVKAGDGVNLEYDVIAKYVESMLNYRTS